MAWNWEQADWPHFTYDKMALDPLESEFLLRSGEFLGVFRHVGPDDRDQIRIDLISEEALKTSEIEGEYLNRESLQSSLRQQLGLGGENRRIPPAERGIAEMMADVYLHFAKPLSHRTLYAWHKMVMSGERRIETIGNYRQHADAMQIVSNRLDKPKVHFEAPPSSRVKAEMDAFTIWFNDTAPKGKTPLPALTRAGIAHLYFESIHPFEDGNGRIGRALCEKAMAQNLGEPSLIALAYTIERHRKAYYDRLEASNKSNAITDWLLYFADTILEAQRVTLARVEFSVAKAKFYERHRDQFNERQEKVIARMFREGIDGFKGGLSAENYIAITQASRATATRDLQDLVAKSALTRTGELRHTRYTLNICDDRA
ncbi:MULTISPECIES: Fic family protein [unclassified Mesorhizobium]|uniref:Fic family protein n=1 Tax=unclassified Mesorhizobium TaxID=325217 RepID=UPI001CCE42C3|nr:MULTISPECIES: Fic family protein [unclassified Mesorhizobium]MBZ9736446.1 Fic family protein [Mesorhizobium sp. CA9]MBZ9815963.1 Fic family protein [Mesorhizobium sp. CA7]MBZ9825676.1 Fic family protein [Mesorhizobium sp. CA18]MBZ9831770.1 Fic family protein [Mesorhizobium sp. CA2]MBZ9839119.1 Fic family protein [Mesorhizobium sp. CA3]